MENIIKVALAKELTRQTKNTVIAPGDYNIEETLTLRVKGFVRKGEDADYTPTVDIPLIVTLALVLEKAGFQRERAKALLTEAMTEALEAGVEARDNVAQRVKDIDAAIAHVQEVTAALPKKTRSGATTVRIVIDEPVAEAA